MKKFIFLILLCLIIGGVFYLYPFFLTQEIYIEPQPLIENPSLGQEIQLKKIPKVLEDLQTVKSLLIFTQQDFLEANLQEMKIRAYQGSFLKAEFPILRRGNPEDWGGTPVGLYQVIAKYKAGYSSVSRVYMPYAVHYYGKYFLHGEPYYPKGGKLVAEFSGGCVQMQDNNAEVIYGEAEKGMPVLVIDKENDWYDYLREEKIIQFPEISAESYLIADLDSGFIFAEKKPEEKLQISSLASLMLATVASENIDFKKTVLIKNWMLESGGSTKGLAVGKKFNMLDLFYPLLIESSNDAAEVLSSFLGKEGTIKLMNEKAVFLQMADTVFADSSSADLESISTAHDLFFLARYIFNVRPPIWEITKGNQVPCVDTIRFKDLANKNIFYAEDNFIGGKTSCSDAFGCNGIFLFKFVTKEGISRNVAIILLGLGNLENEPEYFKNDLQKIIDWLKENYFK